MTHLRPTAIGIMAALAALFLCLPAGAQDGNLGQFDPSDMYFQAWLTLRDAKKAEKNGEFLEAFNKYDKAKKLFDTVALYHPQWKADLVKDRQSSTGNAMEAIRGQALGEQRQEDKKVEDLVGNPEQPAPARPALEIPRPSPDDRQKVANLQARIEQLRTELARARNDRDLNAARLKRTLAQLEAHRDQLARAPVASQMEELERRIAKSERERDAMALALRESRLDHQRALADLATLQADTDAAKQRAADLQKNLDVQQRAANQVVTGLRRQLKELQDTLKEKDKLLASANVRAEQLARQLKEAHDEIVDLRDERDSLLKERDQMAALLKLNESDRVQRLIEQNMKLGRELKHAQVRVQEIFADNNHTKDQLNEAKRDLAVAKARILELRREHESQKSRLAEMEDRLKNAGREVHDTLSKGGLADLARDEMEMLRDMISRQLRVQERRRQAKELVLAEVRKLGIRDNAFSVAFDMLMRQELQLTEEESQLIKDFKVDEEFIFSDRPTPEELAVSERTLQQNVVVKEDLARRAYSNSRFLASREVFESILDEHPGHVPTMLNLGVVHLRLDEADLAINCFNDALVIRGESRLPFAHFMLGVSHYRLQDYEASRTCLLRAIDLDPTNAKAHVFLGNVSVINDHPKQAEHYWREAIRLDSTLTEPFFNLAVLEATRKNKAAALKLYRSALRNGADPDLEFEARIAQ